MNKNQIKPALKVNNLYYKPKKTKKKYKLTSKIEKKDVSV